MEKLILLQQTVQLDISSLLDINPGEAVFQIERTTFDKEKVITNVLLTYHKDYRLKASL